MVLSPNGWPLLVRRGLAASLGGLALRFHAIPWTKARIIAFAAFARGWRGDLLSEGKEGGREGAGDGDNGEVFLGWVLLMEFLFFRALLWRFLANAFSPTTETCYALPHPAPRAKGLASFRTVLLLLSGVCSSRGYRSKSVRWLVRTLLLGGVFLLCQALELRCLPTPATRGALFSSLYLLTGCHGLHVVRGLLWILVLLVTMQEGLRTTTLHIRVLYWHFVDLVWLRVFVLCYS